MLAVDSLLKYQASSPERVAFCENERVVDYRSFCLQVASISARLVDDGVNPGDRVALLLPRGIDAACSIYAILFVGACYVPLDIKNPDLRLAFIVEDVQADCLLGEGDRPAWYSSGIWINLLESSGDATAKIDIEKVYCAAPEALAAILYTSGSTGNPKGVSISHRAIDAFVQWTAETFTINGDEHIASLAPFHFDLSLFDLFTSVYCAAKTSFVPQSLTLAPGKLVNWLEEQGISSWYTVPSILGFLTLRGGLKLGRLPALKRILFAGELFSIERLNKLASLLPDVALYNLFGPTETNVCSYWLVDRARLTELKSSPIGGSACGASFKIDSGGELLVDGPCVMSGYWQGGGLQKKEAGWYRTGDRVSENERGELVYHGRIDRMIKSSGYRIEPAEVELVINHYDGVQESLVLGKEDMISGQRLVAAVVGEALDMQGLKIYLKHHLPSYMQPYKMIFLDFLPLLSNGKVDIQKVKAQLEGL
ncbi:MAG: AMP-binding protein [Mariprofundus sp.]|nr:AMP-binding protein [Mariprofundus sp.]